MLRINLEVLLGPGRKPLPEHLGGVLHGFVEGGVKRHAPHLLPVMRPHGLHAAAHLMILPPPLGHPEVETMKFAIVLYGELATAWPVLVRALMEQQDSGFQGRRMRIKQAWCTNPAGETFALLEQGQLIEFPDGLPVALDIRSMVDEANAGLGPTNIHRLTFRSPLLLASGKAQRDPRRLANGLPWPTLGSVLDSIADRMHVLEPELAAALGLSPDWAAPESARCIQPMTPAAAPARQIEWQYTSTPRSNTGDAPTPRRTLPVPGLVGELIYPATGIEHESQLLHWGQWLGVGQKTTMGCGSYALATQ